MKTTIELTKKNQNKHDVFVFKVTLNDCTPRVWRRIEVPATYTFFDLHCAIQDAMGWIDSHLHAFRIDTRGQSKSKQKNERGTIITIEFPNPEGNDEYSDECYDERKEKIAEWFGTRMTQCVYEYDFGDSWDHTVLFEKKVPCESGVTYPRCTAGKNACPPDDCGGVGGYDDLQKIMKNPAHEEHADMLEWLCIKDAEEFDPKHFDPAEVEFQDPKKRLKEYEQGFGVAP
ncbi:MAG: plasmid pRiA4b ORF-3 family protein [Patescibacteria group bacterium]